MLLSNKLCIIAVSLLFTAEAKSSLISSSSSSSKSGSTSVSSNSGSDSGSKYDMYTASGSSNGSGSSSDSSDETDVEVVSRCIKKDHAALVINEDFGRRLAAISDYFEKENIRANFVINGSDLVNSLNRKSKIHVTHVKTLRSQKHGIIIQPDNCLPASDLNAKQFLRTVQISAVGIQSVIGFHPRLVHVPGGLGNTKADKKKASLLKKYGYTVIQWNQDFTSRAKDVKSLVKRTKKSSKKSKRSKKSKKSKKSRRLAIDYTSSSSSRSSSSSKSRSRRKDHKKGKKARGHIFYGHIGRSFKHDIPHTVDRLLRRGYKLVDLQRCSGKSLYRRVSGEIVLPSTF